MVRSCELQKILKLFLFERLVYLNNQYQDITRNLIRAVDIPKPSLQKFQKLLKAPQEKTFLVTLRSCIYRQNTCRYRNNFVIVVKEVSSACKKKVIVINKSLPVGRNKAPSPVKGLEVYRWLNY